MNKFILPILFAGLISACNTNQNEKTVANQENHQQRDSSKSPMMAAMNQSMHGMHEAKQTGNPDYDFAAMMIPHHQGAVAMAEALVAETQDQELLAFGNEVIDAQQKEIAEMTEFLKTASTKPIAKKDHFKSAMQTAMEEMMTGMHDHQSDGNLDQDFVVLMIPHHQSAVAMAKAYLPFAQDSQLKKIAEDVISSQEREIAWLKEKVTRL